MTKDSGYYSDLLKAKQMNLVKLSYWVRLKVRQSSTVTDYRLD